MSKWPSLLHKENPEQHQDEISMKKQREMKKKKQQKRKKRKHTTIHLYQSAHNRFMELDGVLW